MIAAISKGLTAFGLSDMVNLTLILIIWMLAHQARPQVRVANHQGNNVPFKRIAARRSEPGRPGVPEKVSTARPSSSSYPKARFVSEALASPQLADSEWQVIVRYPHRQLIAYIYQHESGFGKYDVCRSIGKFNGFGYGEWPGHSPTCFGSFETVVRLVNDLIQRELDKGLTYDQIGYDYICGPNATKCSPGYSLTSGKGVKIYAD